MFKAQKLASSTARVALDWAVVMTNYAGNTSLIADCHTETKAKKIANALNDTARVAITTKDGNAMRTSFTFANRVVRTEHDSLCKAVAQARHTVETWRTVLSVVIHGDRRCGYPYIGTITKGSK